MRTVGNRGADAGRAAGFWPPVTISTARTLAAWGLVGLLAGPSPARADTYTAPDGSLVFSYPRRWQAENDGPRIRITAPDGTHYFLLRDTISSLPGDSPAANPEMKVRAAELVKPLLKDAALASAQPVSMDHGLGAAFRYHGPARADTAPPTIVYLGFVRKHSLVLLPEHAGQSSQSIGVAGILQTVAFTDALPKSLPHRGPGANGHGDATMPIAGPGTVSFTSQIAPILKDKCEVCHRASAPLGGFSVTSYADVIKGGRHGELILAGKPEFSSLMDYLTGRRELMPKGGPPLPADRIALIRQWIAEGARQQIGGVLASTSGAKSNPAGTTPGFGAGANRLRPGLAGDAGAAARRANRPVIAQVAAGPQLLEG